MLVTSLRLVSLLLACQSLTSYVSAQPEFTLNAHQQDSVQAAAYYSLGKTLYEQGDLSAALNAYLRSYQWDVSQHELLKEIVPLAASQQREALAVRFALLQANRQVATPEMLRRLALHATQNQQWEAAARLYDQWLQQADRHYSPFERTLIQLERGRLAAALGHLSQASEWFVQPQQTLLTDPTSDLARRLSAALGGTLRVTLENIGECHLAAGKIDQARQAFAASAASPEDEYRLLYWSAEIALARRQPLEAFTYLQEYFAQHEDQLGMAPYALLRQAMVQLNQREELAATYQELAANRPASPYPIAALADWQATLGNSAAARVNYRRLVTAAQPDATVEVTQDLFAEAGDWLFASYLHQSEFNQLISLLQELAATDPLLSLFADSLDTLDLTEEQKQELSARVKLLHASESTPAESIVGFRLSMELGVFDLAKDFANRCVQQISDSPRDVCISLAIDLLEADQPAHSAWLLQQAMSSGKVPADDSAAWFYLSTSLALAMDGQADEALQAARTAAKLQPEVAQFAIQPAWVLQQIGQQDQAIHSYKTFLDSWAASTEADAEAVVQEARRMLSYLVLQQGDKQQAAELLMRVLDNDPHDIGALNDLGYQWANEGQHLSRAARMIQQAVDAEPTNPAYLDSLGWVNYRLGNLAAAVDAIERALSLQRQDGGTADAEILLHYGEILFSMDRKQQAIATWNQALQQVINGTDQAGIATTLREKIEFANPGGTNRPHPSNSGEAP